MLKLRNQFLDRRIAALTQKASKPGQADEERVALLREQQELRRQKHLDLSQLLK